MDDCRVTLLRARIAALPSEVARLNAEVEAVLAARAAGESPWASELPPLILQRVLELLQWEPAVCGNIRAVCSTWSSLHDALRPGRLKPRRSLALMEGKLGWLQSVTELDLTECEDGVCGPLVELQSMPSLRSLSLPASCAESAVDAEAVCGITTLTFLGFYPERYENGVPVEEMGEWVLDLSRLPTLTSLKLWGCASVTDKQVQELSKLTGLTSLNLRACINATAEGLRLVSSLTALTNLNASGCPNVTAEVLHAMSSLTALTSLDLFACPNVTDEGLYTVSGLTALSSLSLGGCINVSSEGLRAVSSLSALSILNLSHCTNVTAEVLRAVSSLSALTTLYLHGCDKVTDEGLRAVSSLTGLTDLNISYCTNVTAAGKQALRTAIPHLTIEDRL
jgi:hypothetical protein